MTNFIGKKHRQLAHLIRYSVLRRERCQSCFACVSKLPEKNQGALKVISNFVFQDKHVLEYDEFLYERQQGKGARKGGLGQSQFVEIVLKFVVETFSSLSIIENASFRAFLFKSNSTTVRRRKTLIKVLESYFCSTADIWSTRKRSYHGLYEDHYI